MATPAAKPSRPTRAALFFPAGLVPSRRRDVGARAFAAGAFRRPIVLISYLQLATGSGRFSGRGRRPARDIRATDSSLDVKPGHGTTQEQCHRPISQLTVPEGDGKLKSRDRTRQSRRIP